MVCSVVAGGNGAGSNLNQLKSPRALFLTAAHDLYVSEATNNRVTKWAAGASVGEVQASVDAPYGVAVDSNGAIVAAHHLTHEVSSGPPDSNRSTVAGTGSSGSALNKLNKPADLMLDASENLLVVDRFNHRVLKFARSGLDAWEANGVVVAGGQNSGPGLGQLKNPAGMDMDAAGGLYIADTTNNRIMKWEPPASAGTVLVPGLSNPPFDVAVDAVTGIIYIALSDIDKVMAWDITTNQGVVVAGQGGTGPGLDQLNYPNALVFRDGNLYISEAGNNRVLRCSTTTTSTATSTSTSSASSTTSSESSTSTATTTSTSSGSSTTTGSTSSTITSTLSSTTATTATVTSTSGITSSLSSTTSTSATVSSTSAITSSLSSTTTVTDTNTGTTTVTDTITGTTTLTSTSTNTSLLSSTTTTTVTDTITGTTTLTSTLSTITSSLSSTTVTETITGTKTITSTLSTNTSTLSSTATITATVTGTISATVSTTSGSSTTVSVASSTSTRWSTSTWTSLRSSTGRDQYVTTASDTDTASSTTASTTALRSSSTNTVTVTGTSAPAAVATPVPPSRLDHLLLKTLTTLVQEGVGVESNRSVWLELNTSLGSLLLASLDAPPGGEGVSFAARGGGKALLSGAVLRELPAASSFVSLLELEEGRANSDLSNIKGGELKSKPVDISIYDVLGGYVQVHLTEPILFRLPGSRGNFSEDLVCAYLDVSGPQMRWSTWGVRRATDAEVVARGEQPDGIWCWTNHLSIFAAILEAVLGCTNVELLSGEALSAITSNAGWYRANSSLITFCVVSLLLQAMVLGKLWEWWQLRLGRTHQSGKPLRCCRNLLTWGPQLLKHKYAAFVVYVRDLVKMLRSDRAKLKNASLTQSVQRFLAVRTGISVACVSQHCWNGGAWVQTSASIPMTTLCRKLEFHGGEAEAVMSKYLFGVGPGHALLRFLMTVAAVHPFLDSMRVGAGSLTVGKRTTLQVCGLLGVLATNALIFNFSGSLRSWESDAECPIDPRSHFFILVATFVSIGINVIPNAFLMDFAKQVHGRPMWNCLFWSFVAVFLLVTGLLITVALANLNRKDQAKWYASLEWSMSIKLFGMPFMQGVRHSLVMEIFLWMDRNSRSANQFKVVMGLGHPNEEQLPLEAQQAAADMARHAISAQGLVQFTSLLGQIVMLDYDPGTSTCDEVVIKAIRPLCARAPANEDCPVLVTVKEVSGLRCQEALAEFTCGVLHLGKQVSHSRSVISEQWSTSLTGTSSGTCSWNLQASVTGLEMQHALGFLVRQGGQDIGVAWLPAEEALQSLEWSGELLVYQPEDEYGANSFVMPPQVASVPVSDFQGSRGRSSGLTKARLAVKIELEQEYLQALSLRERQKLRTPNMESTELTSDWTVEASWAKAQTNVLQAEPDVQLMGCDPFCAATASFYDELAMSRMVVHSGRGKFHDLVAHVLADALGASSSAAQVRKMLAEKDFSGLLYMLQSAGSEGRRYWIDIFALNPSTLEEGVAEGRRDWHEAVLASMPTILRQLRWASCQYSIQQIGQGKGGAVDRLTQLLVLDESFCFMHERVCMAEMMLAKAMGVSQRLVLHPSHAKKAEAVGAEFGKLADELQSAFREGELPWTTPYLENKQAVYDLLRDLVVAGIREQKDSNSLQHDFDISSLVATWGAVAATASSGSVTRRTAEADTTGADDIGATDAGDVDVDAGG